MSNQGNSDKKVGLAGERNPCGKDLEEVGGPFLSSSTKSHLVMEGKILVLLLPYPLLEYEDPFGNGR